MFGSNKKINLTDIIDIKLLQEFQDSFANTVNVASLTIDSHGPITKPSNFTDFCMNYTRGSALGLKHCNECDIKWGQLAAVRGEPVIYKCHTGLTDFAVPIIVEGQHVASILGGQVLTEAPDEEHFRQIARDLVIDEDDYIEAVKKIKVIPLENIQAAAKLLYLVANSISEIGHKNFILMKKNEQESLYRQITETVRSSLDTNETRIRIVNIIGETLGADRCFINEFDKKNDKFLKAQEEYLSSDNIISILDVDVNTLAPVFADAFKDGNPLIINNKEIIINIDKNNLVLEDQAIKKFKVNSALAFPFYYSDELLGVLSVHYERKHVITDEEINLINIFAGQIAIALYQAKLYKKTQENAEREFLIRNITEKIRRSFDIETIKHEVVTQLGKLLKADRVTTGYFDNEKNIHVVSKSAEYRSSDSVKSFVGLDLIHIPGFAENIRSIHLKGKDIIFSNLEKYLEENNLKGTDVETFYREYGYASSIALNLSHQNVFLGNLVITFSEPRDFSVEEIDFLKSLTTQIGLAFHQTELFKKYRKQAERERLLREIVSEISSTLDFNQIRKMLVTKLGTLLESDLDVLYLYDSNSKKFLPVDEYSVHLSSKDIENPVGTNIVENYGWHKYIVENTKSDIVYSYIEDLKNDYNLHGTKPAEFLDKYNIKSMIAIPINYANNFLGFFVMNFIKDHKIVTQEDVNLVKVVANQAAIALYQSRLYTQSLDVANSKGEFIANVSHELKTPLNVIIGFSDLLYNTQFPREKEMEYLKFINQSGKQLFNMTDNIINMSKIDSKIFTLHYEDINSKDLILDVVNSITIVAKEKNISIETNLKNITVSADKAMLTRILNNLLGNAIKFNPINGKIFVSSDFENGNIIVSVKDTGIGIDLKDHELIFEKFRQIDSSYTKEQNGVGLGLSITKKLVELHNGSIYVDSIKNQGATFCFVLPNASEAD